MKRLLYILLLVFCKCSVAQNLVQNGSFEVYDSCPYTASQINFSTGWFQPNTCCNPGGTTDYYNACDDSSTFLDVRVPINWYGYQNSVNGVAYAGIITYNYLGLNYREYLEGQLMDSLIAGKKYCIEFYVSLADSANYAIDKIGAYLSPNKVLYNGSWTYLPLSPQIFNAGTVISDKNNWIKISGEYIASGGEKFITIGNFSNDSNTIVNTVGGGIMGEYQDAYYYIDDVSVVRCDCNNFPTAKFGYTTDTLKVNFTDATTGAVNYWQWDFGDGTSTSSAQNPVHTYDSSGTYSVMLIACDSGCCDTAAIPVTVVAVGIEEFQSENYSLRIYPNPTGNKISFSNNFSGNTITIINILGQKIYSGKFEKELDVLFLPAGVYVIEVAAQQKIFRAKILKE